MSPNRPRRLGGMMLVVAAAAAVLGPAPDAAAQETPQEAPQRTTLDGVYTAEQAEEGREIYMRACAACHVLDYYTGQVVEAWEGVPVYDLYDLIRTKMPENNPGSLRPREYVAMLAYILELNGMPPGEEALSARGSALRSIIFRWRPES